MKTHHSISRFSLVLTLFMGLAASQPLVHLGRSDVTYRGVASDSVEHFRNIKFAHDTSGKRRFAPPEPFAPPKGTVVDATASGPACPQLQDPVPPAFSAVDEISEDCLNLRIARPEGTTADDRLPVLVWIHGGGIVRGSAYDDHFDPAPLLHLSISAGQHVLYVATQHRLSIFGFASLDTLHSQQSLNVGLRDQRVAFEWLKTNIAAFGGDPERITAYGHSSGGTLLSLQLFAHGGQRGLPFDQAWMMSGPPGTSTNMTSGMTTLHTKAVAQELGCGLAHDLEILNCLRKAPMQDLLKAAMEYSIANHPPLGLFTFLPSVDGDFLPDRPSVLLREGAFVKGVPSILGWTQDDGAMNAGPAPFINSPEDMATPIRNFASELSPDQMSKLISEYPASDFERDVEYYNDRKGPDGPPVSPYYFALSRLLRDLLFTCPSIDFSYHMMKQSRQDKSHKSRFDAVRLYDLNQSALSPMWGAVGMPWIGVSHGSDISYMFNGVFPEGPMNPSDSDLARGMSGSLISFAYTGSPVAHSATSSAFKSWPVAYESIENDEEDLVPFHYNVQVLGGPYGTSAARVLDSQSKRPSAVGDGTSANAEAEYDAGLSGRLGLGKLQEVLSNTLSMGGMGGATSPVLSRKLEQEKLFERCAYIASISESVGN